MPDNDDFKRGNPNNSGIIHEILKIPAMENISIHIFVPNFIDKNDEIYFFNESFPFNVYIETIAPTAGPKQAITFMSSFNPNISSLYSDKKPIPAKNKGAKNAHAQINVITKNLIGIFLIIYLLSIIPIISQLPSE
ncbi:hypothetical protein PilKf_01474 [Pillotina sp. SPG140]